MRSMATLVFILSFLTILSMAQSALMVHMRLRQREPYNENQSKPTTAPTRIPSHGTKNEWLWSKYKDFMEDAAEKGKGKNLTDWLMNELQQRKNHPRTIIRLF